MELESNNPKLKSWVDVPEESDFPIQNLPFGVFSTESKKRKIGVAIGDKVLDLNVLFKKGLLQDCGVAKNVFKRNSLNPFFAHGREVVRNVRERVSELLREGNKELGSNTELQAKALKAINDVKMHLPVKVGNYTDFYSSREHATNVGSMFRDPNNALLPNWLHLPVGYHGRASSIIPTGDPVIRPKGQVKSPGEESPKFSPSNKLDFELEMAFITCKETELGETVSIEQAEEYIIGLTIFNDWSARDIQAWEYVPLGPFLGKSFASSMSPWVVTLDALEPFKVSGPKQTPEVLPYLSFEGDLNYDIDLEVSIMTEDGSESIVCSSNSKYLYWNIYQQLAHQTINGCNIEVGDVYASGTISGPEKSSFGSMLELSWNGKEPVNLKGGNTRVFLEDGDIVKMKGFAQKGDVRIGFGSVENKIYPAK